jgi:hypothetical protein
LRLFLAKIQEIVRGPAMVSPIRHSPGTQCASVVGIAVTGVGFAVAIACTMSAIVIFPLGLVPLVAAGAVGLAVAIAGCLMLRLAFRWSKIDKFMQRINFIVNSLRNVEDKNVVSMVKAYDRKPSPKGITAKLIWQCAEWKNMTMLMAAMQHCDGTVQMAILDVLQRLPAADRLRILTKPNDAGWNLPMFAMRHGSPEVQRKILAMLSELSQAARAKILAQQEFNSRWNFVMLALKLGDDGIRLEMLQMLENLFKNDRAAILEQQDDEGWCAVSFAISCGGDEVQIKMAEILKELPNWTTIFRQRYAKSVNLEKLITEYCKPAVAQRIEEIMLVN